MKKNKVLVVDDTEVSLILIKATLEDAYDVSAVNSSQTALGLIRDETFDLVILDIVMPEIDGYQLCQAIRKNERYALTPILFISGRNSDHEKVLGFQVGGDDFITKPFNAAELRARIDARFRHTRSAPRDLAFGGLMIDEGSHQVFRGSDEIRLTRIEFRILQYLARHPDQLKTRVQIIEAAWKPGVHIAERTVDTHISHLRKKLGPEGELIEAVHSEGYRISSDRALKAA